MRQIFAIAILSLRNAIRSRMVACLIFVLAAVITLIPLTIKGDGTIAGFVQVLLSYTLGLTVIVLSMTTFWAGSASVSSEINDKTIQMVGTKPVSTWQLWLGKWIGLNMMNLALLMFAGCITYVLLHWHLQPSRLTQEQYQDSRQLLMARSVIEPHKPDIESIAKARLQDRLSRQPLPGGVSSEQALRDLRQQVKIDENTIRPGTSKEWTFGMVEATGDTPELTIQYRFTSSMIDQDAVKGRWLVGTRTKPDMVTIEKSGVPRAINQFRIPYNPVWKSQPLILTYIDVNTEEATLLIDLDQGLVLMSPRGSFNINFVYALCTMAGQLSFFAALGVTAGCLFSLPVAAFVSMFLLLLVQLGSYIQGMALNEIIWTADPNGHESMGLATVAILLVFKTMAVVLAPLIQDNALNQLASGILIDAPQVMRSLFLQGIAYALLLGLFASYVMNRRELALPQS